MSVSRKIELTDLTPGEVAELFCDFDSDDQVSFFEAIDQIAATWPGAGWCQQSCEIARSCSPKARAVIQKLAEHVLDYDPSGSKSHDH